MPDDAKAEKSDATQPRPEETTDLDDTTRREGGTHLNYGMSKLFSTSRIPVKQTNPDPQILKVVTLQFSAVYSLQSSSRVCELLAIVKIAFSILWPDASNGIPLAASQDRLFLRPEVSTAKSYKPNEH